MLKSVASKEVIMTVNDEKLRILNGKRCNLRANDKPRDYTPKLI